MAKEGYEGLYTKLDIREGARILYKIAKTDTGEVEISDI